MAKKDVHVVPHPEGWATRKEGSERAGGVYDTQREAIERARARASAAPASRGSNSPPEWSDP